MTVDDLLKRQEEGPPIGNDRAAKRQKLVHLPRQELDSDSDDNEVSGSEQILDWSEAPSEENANDRGGAESGEEDEVRKQENRDEVGSLVFTMEDRMTSFVKKKLESRRSTPATEQPTITSFTSFGVSPALVAALASMSIKVPTPVQAACIPPLLAGA